MAAILGKVTCVDPKQLYAACVSASPPIPTESWYGKANGFDLAPVGRGPGKGWLLIRYGNLSSLNLGSDFTLTFSGTDSAHQYTLQKITVLGATAATPGWQGDPNAVFLVEATDRRYHLARLPVDKAYNVRSADGTSQLTGTLNSGSPWTWQQVVNDLATACGLDTAQFALPFAPDATPEDLTYWAGFAWEALNDVLDRLACAPQYDVETDTFSVVRLGTADADATQAMAGAFSERTWDGYPTDPVRAWRPEKVRVQFLRRPRPTDGSTPYYAVDVTLAATTGVVSGSFVQLQDDLAALGATGAPTNSSALTTRANERAADWLRKRSGFGRPVLVIYRDFIPEIVRKVPGAIVGSVAIDDRGSSMRTEVATRLDTALEKWKPLDNLPPWYPEDPVGTFARLTTSGANSSGYGTGWKYVEITRGDGFWVDVGAGIETDDYIAFSLTDFWLNPYEVQLSSFVAQSGMEVRLFPMGAIAGFVPLAQAPLPGSINFSKGTTPGDGYDVDALEYAGGTLGYIPLDGSSSLGVTARQIDNHQGIPAGARVMLHSSQVNPGNFEYQIPPMTIAGPNGSLVGSYSAGMNQAVVYGTDTGDPGNCLILNPGSYLILSHIQAIGITTNASQIQIGYLDSNSPTGFLNGVSEYFYTGGPFSGTLVTTLVVTTPLSLGVGLDASPGTVAVSTGSITTHVMPLSQANLTGVIALCGGGSGSIPPPPPPPPLPPGCLTYTDSSCCPGACWPIPTAHVTVSGPCASLNGTFAVTNSSGGVGWIGAGPTYNGHATRFLVGCTPSVGITVGLQDTVTGTIIWESADSVLDCVTPQASGTATVTGGACNGNTIDWSFGA